MGNCADENCYAHHHGIEGAIAKVRRDIRRVGWSVVVLTDGRPFAYTVGLTEKRIPELYLQMADPSTPTNQLAAQRTLNAIGRHLVEHRAEARHASVVEIHDDDGAAWTYVLGTRFDIKPLGMANRIYNGRFRALEVSLTAARLPGSCG